MDFRLLRRLVGGVDTGKVANFPRPRFFIEPFWVELFTDGERRID
jgi:hypothetical protein